MLRDTEVAFLPAPGMEAPPRRTGKLARGALVSLGLLASLTLGLYGTTSHEHRATYARNALSLYGWAFGFRKYDQVQYFGFNLFTAPGRSIDGCFGAHEDATKCHLSSPSVAEDIQQRADILLKAIYAAHSAEHVDHRSRTLKIFLAPEWYWTGPQGAYLIDGGISGDGAKTINKVMVDLMGNLAHPMFQHWVFVLGTFVMGERDADYESQEAGKPKWEKMTYYNFAPIQVGGTEKSYVEFKHYITQVDWQQGFVDRDQQEDAMAYCHTHRCLFGYPSLEVMESLGFGNLMPLQGSRFDVGGVAIGVEVDHDHKFGKLEKALDISQSVDVHLIVSQGMTIAMGPVCTRTGGPVFLADGSARTEMSLNPYGIGRRGVVMPNGKFRYGLGVAYGADSLVEFQQWLGDILVIYTGQSWGPRAPGEGTLPGGSIVDGTTGVRFHRIPALGESWRQTIHGYYRTASYDKAQEISTAFWNKLKSDGNGTFIHQAAGFVLPDDAAVGGKPKFLDAVKAPLIAPTIDMYGPLELVDTDRLWD